MNPEIFSILTVNNIRRVKGNRKQKEEGGLHFRFKMAQKGTLKVYPK